jgi:[acyl-carrier-protein] S-malonyltransferase
MGRDLAAAYPAARRVFDEVDEALGVPLSRLAFEGPADELTLTHNAQPALLAHGAAAWAVVRDAVGARVKAAAGHSLGEFTAYHAADALPLADAARLVRRRGELMLEAGAARPGAMAAFVGELTRSADDICAEASAAGEVVAANYNSDHQVVVSGEVAGVEQAMALAKAAHARRAIRLNVSGAFHSPLMAPAQAGLAAALESARFTEARFPIYANVNAEPVRSPSDARRLLTQQLTGAVRWTSVVRALAAAHPDALYVELGPGKVLRGLVQHIMPGLKVAHCGSPADVDALLTQLA